MCSTLLLSHPKHLITADIQMLVKITHSFVSSGTVGNKGKTMEQMQIPSVRTHEELRSEPNYINLEPAIPGGGGTFQTISTYPDPSQLINSNYHIHPANYYALEHINTIPASQNHYGQPPDIQQQQPQFPNDHAMMNELSAEDLKSDDEMNKEKLRKSTHN